MRVSVQNLTCRRAGRVVFRDFSFEVAEGEAAILRGPNGSGKSSLLRQLAGFVPIAAGEARIGEVSLARDPGQAQELVAYAGHLDAVKPALSVAGNLSFWARLHGGGAAEATAALARFGLSEIADSPAQYCSAGQKRRLGLARLLVARRPVWLLDEPTVSLDAAAAGLCAALVREHCASGGAALIATHIDPGLPDAQVVPMPTRRSGAAGDAADDPFLHGAWA